ncbi:MAG: polysaccharide lyase 6 family protein [Spirochaetales bacterium]|nr:polysaccharide lyase 6 family protein [Spirochaetales bacterium]
MIKKIFLFSFSLLLLLIVSCDDPSSSADSSENDSSDNSDTTDLLVSEDFSSDSLSDNWINYDDKGTWAISAGELSGARDGSYTFLYRSDLEPTNTTVSADLSLNSVTSDKDGYVGLFVHMDDENPNDTYCRAVIRMDKDDSSMELYLEAEKGGTSVIDESVSISYSLGESVGLVLDVADNNYTATLTLSDGTEYTLTGSSDDLISGHPSLYVRSGEATFDNVTIYGNYDETAVSTDDDTTTDDDTSSDDDSTSEEEEETADESVALDVAGDGETEVYCADFDALEDAVDNMKAGQTITLADGVYSGGNLNIQNVTAYEDYPVIIEAETSGEVYVDETWKVENSQYITVKGISWYGDDNRYLQVGNNAAHITITECTFNGVDDPSSDSPTLITSNQGFLTISELCDDIEISYNSFMNKNNTGSFIKGEYYDGSDVWGDAGISTNFWIHHNYFYNMLPEVDEDDSTDFEGDSDRESIIFGTKETPDYETGHIIEYNLFEDCDGENEIISSKTSENIIRYNTFHNCLGSVSIRFGAGTEVYNNFFFGDDENLNEYDDDRGGIRAYGSDHLIYNNYMEGLTGTGYRTPIILDSGDCDDASGDDIGGHERAYNCVVVNNTIVNCVNGITVGYNYSDYDALDNTIANNVIYDSSEAFFTIGESSGTTFEGNYAYHSDGADSTISVTSDSKDETVSATTLYATVEDPQLSDDGTVYRPESTSPIIDAGYDNYSYVTVDMDGGTRADIDSGADEYGVTGDLVPFAVSDVGSLIGVPVE